MTTRFTFTLSSHRFLLAGIAALGAAACGGGGGTDDGPTPDAAVKSIGFDKPTASLKAHNSIGENMWEELGPADLSCLGTPANDLPTTVEVALSTFVRDFQSDALVPNTTVHVFPDQNIAAGFPGSPFTAGGDAAVTVTLPVGTKRFGYKMVSSSALDTLLLNQKVLPDAATQSVSSIQSVSKTTAQTLTALIGVSRTAGTGVLAGAMRDCQDREVSNFIATVSTTSGTVTHAAGADTYYFSPTIGLPVKHTQIAQGSANGLFMVIELQPAATAFVQVWGYKTDADLAADNLELVAELPTAVIAETVITGSYEPLRTP